MPERPYLEPDGVISEKEFKKGRKPSMNARFWDVKGERLDTGNTVHVIVEAARAPTPAEAVAYGTGMLAGMGYPIENARLG